MIAGGVLVKVSRNDGLQTRWCWEEGTWRAVSTSSPEPLLCRWIFNIWYSCNYHRLCKVGVSDLRCAIHCWYIAAWSEAHSSWIRKMGRSALLTCQWDKSNCFQALEAEVAYNESRVYIYNCGGLPIGILAFPLLTQRFAAFLTDEKCNKKAKHNRFERRRGKKTNSTLSKTLDSGPSEDMIWVLSWKRDYRKRRHPMIRFMWFFSFMEGIWPVSGDLWSSGLARGSGVVTVTRGPESPVSAAWPCMSLCATVNHDCSPWKEAARGVICLVDRVHSNMVIKGKICKRNAK